MVKWLRHAAINSANKSITHCSKRFTKNIYIHNGRNRHKMFYSLVETGWVRINCTKSRTLYNRVIGDCKKWSVNATIRYVAISCKSLRQQLSEVSWKSFDNSYLRILRNHPRALKRQILILKFTCLIFHYLTDSLKPVNQIKKDCIFWATNETSEPSLY